MSIKTLTETQYMHYIGSWVWIYVSLNVGGHWPYETRWDNSSEIEENGAQDWIKPLIWPIFRVNEVGADAHRRAGKRTQERTSLESYCGGDKGTGWPSTSHQYKQLSCPSPGCLSPTASLLLLGLRFLPPRPIPHPAIQENLWLWLLSLF